MNKRDSRNVAYIVHGLLRDMTTDAPFAVGYRTGVRQMQNAIQMLANGGGLSVDSIVHLARKNVKAKTAFRALICARQPEPPTDTNSERNAGKSGKGQLINGRAIRWRR